MGWGGVPGSFLLESMLLRCVGGAAEGMSSCCSLTGGLEHSGNSSIPGEGILRPGRVLLLMVLAESQSDASVLLTQEAVGK